MNALSTSVGRKVVMSITGLLLCGFLVVHLAGNLLLYAGDDGKTYNEYAHALHKNTGLLMIAETGLFALFIAHIVIALQVSAENRAARKVGYAMTRSKQEGRYVLEGFRPDTWMLATGMIVLGFLMLHLIDFKMEWRSAVFYEANGQKLEPFDKAKALLSTSNMLTIFGYAVGSFALLAHLAHGFQSAFQTLGINHPKYTPLIKLVGLLFAIAIGVGFATFPLIWAWSH
jgi:succinate dehydrogenase / fumarate reductase cytochrome b subunit